MNWTANITYKQQDSGTCTEVCETHRLRGMNVIQVLDWMKGRADAGDVDSLSIWLEDITDEQTI